MSAHDYLMSKIFECKKLLKEFCDEHEPTHGASAICMMNDLALIVHNMPSVAEQEYEEFRMNGPKVGEE